jgi:hypothetical protein
MLFAARRHVAAANLSRILVAAGLVFATAAYAQSEKEELPLTATLTLGFDSGLPARRGDAWTPLSALLENLGDPIKGRLVAQVYYGLEPADIFYSCPVDLPTGSRKMYHVAVFLPGEGAEVQVSAEYGRKRVLLGQLATPVVEDQLVGALTRERDRLNFLATGPEEAGEIQTIRRILYVDAQTLPTQWIAYHGLDVVIWAGGQVETALLPEQLSAFRNWLTMGGRFVLFAGSLRQELTDTPWAEFLPLELTSSETLPAGTLLEGSLFRDPQTLSRPVVVSTGTLVKSLQPRVLLRAGDIPVVVEVDWGAGTVIYCAFEPQPSLLTSGEATLYLWDVLLTGLGSLPVYVTAQLDPIVSRFLRSLVQAELPSAWFIAGFLGLYILLVVPLNYLVFRRFRRLEWAWLMVPVWAVVFTVAAYHIGAIYQKGTVSLNALSVIEAFPSSTRGRATSFVSVYSPVRRWYDVRFTRGNVFPLLVGEDGFFGSGLSPRAGQTLAVHYDPDATVIADILIHHWSQRIVKAAHAVDLGNGVAIDLTWDNETLVGTVTNRTPYTILDPALYVMDRRYRLGARLEPDQSRSVPLSYEPCDLPRLEEEVARLQGMVPYSPRGRAAPRTSGVGEFAPLYRYWLHYDPFGKDLSLFTGWVNHLFLQPELDRSISQQEGRALLAILFSAYSWPAGIIQIPPSSWYIQRSFVRGMPFLVGRRVSESLSVQPGRQTEYALMTDLPLRGCQVRRLRIEPADAFIRQLRDHGVSNKPIICIQNRRTKEWQEVPWRLSNRRVDPWAVEAEDVADPHAYVNQRSGTIAIQIDNRGSLPIGVGDDSLTVTLEVDYRGYIGGQRGL